VSGLLHLAASAPPPAGGAATAEVVGATAAALVLTTALLALGRGHRSGRIPLLGRAADLAGRVGGLPSWAALPAGLAGASLLSAVFGLYWDISLHIDNGRDPGPLANPSHYFILAGLFGIFAAGWLAIVLPTERPGPAAIRIAPGWEIPVGGAIMMASSSFALLGFPLDDLWHRLFGQDVTLWGPTHLMMLTGAAMTLIGILALLAEARLAGRDRAAPLTPLRALSGVLTGPRVRTARLVAACGGVLAGLSIYQGEFDFGVPQFRLLFDPVLIALAAGVGLVMARLLVGRGGALAAVVFFIVLRGGLAILVGPVLGESTPHFPLYIVEALLVEGVALAIGTRRPYRFAGIAGVLIGTIGVAAELAWSHVWAPIPWPTHLLAPAVALAVPVAVAGGVIGVFVSSALRARAEIAGTPRGWMAAAAGIAVVAVVVGFLLQTSVPRASAQATLTTVHPGPHRTVDVTVRYRPAAAVRDPDWLVTIAWQGHRKVIVEPLKRVSDGVFRTTTPLPVYGGWKTAIRFHRGDQFGTFPVYLPEDRAIPAAGVAAASQFVRPLRDDQEMLQRERKRDVPAWLWSAASFAVLAFGLALFAAVGWGLARIARAEGEHPQARPRPAAARAPAAAGVA
jgi:hypothetical protein